MLGAMTFALLMGSSAASSPATLLGPDPIPVDEFPVWRAQLRLEICDVSKAGTDNDLAVSLSTSNTTWLNYSRNDFERGDKFTYDLKTEGLQKFGNVTRIRISKTGSDGLCLKRIELRLNETKVFTKSFSNHWLDNSGDLSRVLTINSSELRGTPSWQNYAIPTNPAITISNYELESRIEAAVGDALRRPGAEELVWGKISGEAVNAGRISSKRLVVDLDLKAIVNNWPDQEVDVDFDLNLTCDHGKPTIKMSNVDVDVEADWFTAVVLGVMDFLGSVPGMASMLAIGQLNVFTVALAYIAHSAPTIPEGTAVPDFSMVANEVSVCPATFETFVDGTGIPIPGGIKIEYSPAQLLQIATAAGWLD